MKNVFKILFTICFTLNIFINTFATAVTTFGINSLLVETYLAEDESQNDEIKTIVSVFMNNYITSTMSDFEKEIQIIKYLVQNVEYDTNELLNNSIAINDSYKAYGALVNHKAVCSGYAKAFDLLAKECGLLSIVVTGDAINSEMQNGAHAWNQICFDGEWYNVDVTFEDPITNIDVGFNQLFNNYINCTDIEFAKNHIRENGNGCYATKYGKRVVAYYLNTGIVDFNAELDNVRKMYEKQIEVYNLAGNDAERQIIIDKLLMLGAKYDNNINFIPSGNDVDVTTYVLTCIAKGENVITVVTGGGTQGKLSIDSGRFIEDYIKIPGRCQMLNIFSSDGEFDTRILVFKWG